jgi:hypothetical protein
MQGAVRRLPLSRGERSRPASQSGSLVRRHLLRQGVGRSGVVATLGPGVAQAALTIEAIHEGSHGTYGSARVHAQLAF